jgi:hypothetical protein
MELEFLTAKEYGYGEDIKEEPVRKTTKIAISFTIEIELDSYCEEYGLSRKDAIADIRELVRTSGTEELLVNGYLRQGDVK